MSYYKKMGRFEPFGSKRKDNWCKKECHTSTAVVQGKDRHDLWAGGGRSLEDLNTAKVGAKYDFESSDKARQNIAFQ